jgi:hypothetical protein
MKKQNLLGKQKSVETGLLSGTVLWLLVTSKNL